MPPHKQNGYILLTTIGTSCYSIESLIIDNFWWRNIEFLNIFINFLWMRKIKKFRNSDIYFFHSKGVNSWRVFIKKQWEVDVWKVLIVESRYWKKEYVKNIWRNPNSWREMMAKSKKYIYWEKPIVAMCWLKNDKKVG